MMRGSNLPRLAAGLVIVSAATVLAGCASPEARYYTLSPAAEARPAAMPVPGQAPEPVWIEVAPVRVPERVNRINLVLSNSSGRLKLLQQDRWSASLPDEFRDALSQRLQVSLGAVDTYQHGRPGAEPLYRVSAEVVQIDAAIDERVSAIVHWTVHRLPDGKVTVGYTRAELAAAGGVDGVVAAYQQVVINTAADIAAAVRSLRS
ncbi:PqiC family protein [Cupriavidus sp. CV2]|uniref:PqiC family protein n=1 Tax=Cupriavidus ulmosensis TaxID=3065913 RepID=UPI00296B5543|nr:PqiC family protein [Cupriavidus sp. CV2]MDW3681378.1 PqiC family protein [Cupriavidus sp. CV2]